MNKLTIENLHYHSRGPINLTVFESECVCISGHSGSGKSLLLRSLIDFEPYQGVIHLDKVESQTITAPQWRKMLAYLPCESQWWGEVVGDHFASIPENLKQLGFGKEVMNWEVARLSTGEKQRLALARALLNSPKGLLLDEATSSLDPVNTIIVEELIISYMRKNKTPVIWVSHDIEQVRRIADRYFHIQGGKLIEKDIP